MPKRRTSNDPAVPNLLVPRAEADKKIRTQIEKGRQTRDLEISREEDLNRAQAEASKWSDYNVIMLRRLFDDPSVAQEYNRGVGKAIPFDPKFAWYVKDFQEEMDGNITRLESILESLELYEEPVTEPPLTVAVGESGAGGKDVFVVHGHDETTKQSVARFLEKLDLNVIILHEQANQGRTIIEKFEDFSNVGFAIVILTPDDIGGRQNEPDKQKARARQNVIFELGYFIGKIGRGRVCALYREGVEMPSDYDGVLYVPLGPDHTWQLKIAKEMKQAGLKVDLNKIIK